MDCIDTKITNFRPANKPPNALIASPAPAFILAASSLSAVQEPQFRIQTNIATPEFNQRNDLRQLENPVHPDCVFATP